MAAKTKKYFLRSGIHSTIVDGARVTLAVGDAADLTEDQVEVFGNKFESAASMQLRLDALQESAEKISQVLEDKVPTEPTEPVVPTEPVKEPTKTPVVPVKTPVVPVKKTK